MPPKKSPHSRLQTRSTPWISIAARLPVPGHYESYSCKMFARTADCRLTLPGNRRKKCGNFGTAFRPNWKFMKIAMCLRLTTSIFIHFRCQLFFPLLLSGQLLPANFQASLFYFGSVWFGFRFGPLAICIPRVSMSMSSSCQIVNANVSPRPSDGYSIYWRWISIKFRGL